MAEAVRGRWVRFRALRRAGPLGRVYFLPGSGRGGGALLAAAALDAAAVLVALGFLASRFDFCWPLAMGASW